MTMTRQQRLTRPLPAHTAVRQRLHQPDQLALTKLPGATISQVMPPRFHDLTLPPARPAGNTAHEPRPPAAYQKRSPYRGVSGGLVLVDGVAGQDSVGLAVQPGEPAGAVEAPPAGDASDGPAGRVGGQEILVRAVQPDPQKVGPRRGLQVPGERQ